MEFEDAPPGLGHWIKADITFGICSAVAAFWLRKFILLFLTAASFWFLILFALYANWWSTRHTYVPGTRKIYRSIGLLTGFLIAVLAYYLIVWLDPTLR